ncbi:hypothetical protein [Luteolibacter soli]|uniref:Uncharacterized protein n=1 Tax=Luteolibacter soli TaxID=3135280 RepID=A0ABU9AYJ4_9BACT
MSDPDSPKPKRRFGAGAFSISLLVHLIFVLLAIFYFVKWVDPPQEKLDFLPGGGGGGGNEGQKASQIKAQKRMMTSPAVSKRIASTSAATFSLPDTSPELADAALPMAMSDASSGSGGGAGGGHGTGLGTGTGPGSGPGSGPGVGKGFVSTSFFGSKETRFDALAGHLYDFKQTKAGKPVTDYDTGNPEHFTSRVLELQKRHFREIAFREYFKAPDTLYLTQLAIPNRPAQEGPALFGAADKMKPSGWFAIYSGKLKAPKDMTFRFVGSADDYIGVQTKGKLRLIAARPEIQKTVQERWEPAKTDQEFPGPMGTLVFGDWIQVKKGEEFEMDLGIGERPGGVVGFILLIEEKGKEYKKTQSGRPILPLFTTEPITDQIRDRIGKGFRDWEIDWEDVPVFTNDSSPNPLADPFK